MTDDEAYQKLAVKVRARLSARKLELYQSIRNIEAMDELRDKELVREAGETWCVGVRVGDTTVTASHEQPEAFKLYRNNTEWRAYMDEVKQILEDEEAGSDR